MHCHILPGVDDGSRDMEMSLAMIKRAAEEGITHMVATPHYKRDHHNAGKEAIKDLVLKVQEAADKEKLPVKIYPGNEIMFFGDLEEAYEAEKFRTLNDSKYLLIEFYPDDDKDRIRKGVETVQRLGLRPVLAHAERFLVLRKDTDFLEYLKRMGTKIQVNASSITGDQGFGTKQYVKKLLKKGLVDFVGTDAHSDTGRAPRLKECAAYLYKKYDETYVDAILYKNAIERFNL